MRPLYVKNLSVKQKALVLLAILSLLAIVYILRSPPAGNVGLLPFPSSPSLPLQISGSYPSSDRFLLDLPRIAVIFYFNQSIDLDKLRVEISPQTEVEISLGYDQKSILIRPESSWKTNIEYKFTVFGVKNVILTEKKLTFLDLKQHPDLLPKYDLPPGGI